MKTQPMTQAQEHTMAQEHAATIRSVQDLVQLANKLDLPVSADSIEFPDDSILSVNWFTGEVACFRPLKTYKRSK